MPTFNVNVFIQAKRSLYIKNSSKILRQLGFRRSHYKFYIKEHQQRALDLLYKKLKGKALVSYAAPVFLTFSELYDYQEKRKLVINSTFVRVDRLLNHRCWIFDKPGTGGIASSDPEEIFDESFELQIQRLAKDAIDLESFNRDLIIKQLKQIEKAIFELCVEEQKNKNPITEYYSKMTSDLSNVDDESTLMFKIYFFCDLFKLGWFVVSKDRLM